VFSPESERRRQADLYAFALLAHRSKATLNPLDVSQWEFFLLRASTLNEHLKKQRRITLKRLLGLNAERCSYSDLSRCIEDIEREATQRRCET